VGGQIRFQSARVAALAVLALLALSPAAPGQGAAPNSWRQDGKGVANAPNMASSGDFAIMQVATTDAEKLISDWETPTAGANVATSERMARNQPIVTFIIFQGCKPDASGNCNVTVDYDTTGPSGKLYDHSASVPVWVGYPAAPQGRLQLSASGYGLRIEDTDPLGAYLVRATVTDHVANITLKTQAVLTAVAAK